MISILKWMLFVPIAIAVNFLIRIPIVWFSTTVMPILTGTEGIDSTYSWLAIVLIGAREFAATYATLYIGLKLIDRKIIAFYTGASISISSVVFTTLNYPIQFEDIGFWSSIGELALLAAQIFGVYKAIATIKQEYSHQFHIKDNHPKIRQNTIEANGSSVNSKMKMIGENYVPIGCFYDPAERLGAFKERLDDSIFLALELTEIALLRKFKIRANDLTYEVCVSGQWTKNIKLKQVRELVENYLIKHGDENFGMQLIVNYQRHIIPDNADILGTVVEINYWKDEWYNSIEDENYPVWLISVAGTTTTIEDAFTTEELEHIKASILDQVNSNFNDY